MTSRLRIAAVIVVIAGGWIALSRDPVRERVVGSVADIADRAVARKPPDANWGDVAAAMEALATVPRPTWFAVIRIHTRAREEFLRRVVDWTEKHGGIIIKQLKRLGASCDWSRQRYTFDADYVRAVENVFVDLYRKGYVYRGRRMINWDPAAQTALSDEEVIARPQKGKLYYVRYELVDEPTPARTALTLAGSPPPRFVPRERLTR